MKRKKSKNKTGRRGQKFSEISLNPNQVRKGQFPKNPRTITEPRTKAKKRSFFALTLQKIFLISGIILFVILLSAIGVIGMDTYKTLQAKNSLIQKRAGIFSSINYWNSVVAKYPNYRDGYIQLAALYYQIGDRGKATDNIEKAIPLDPNFEETKELGKIIGER